MKRGHTSFMCQNKWKVRLGFINTGKKKYKTVNKPYLTLFQAETSFDLSLPLSSTSCSSAAVCRCCGAADSADRKSQSSAARLPARGPSERPEELLLLAFIAGVWNHGWKWATASRHRNLQGNGPNNSASPNTRHVTLWIRPLCCVSASRRK